MLLTMPGSGLRLTLMSQEPPTRTQQLFK
ncbi:unnamed protein product [Larinioides sclopetarius]|uniref:Uncharacterized protein n=1 Tax=Larinioides sclopetarius TaxID=280406 RepID=A0AAV2AMS6_9ARAC